MFDAIKYYIFYPFVFFLRIDTFNFEREHKAIYFFPTQNNKY